ncbi:MAG TPA: carbohydrate porin [Rhizomicrobium sp.]|jgi:high affinity Mn2+ porin|nr:carbohydrate porin [Rhizomicrobium sp.]
MSLRKLEYIAHWLVRVARGTALVAALLYCIPGTALAADAPEDWSLHGQMTFVDQYHPAFKSPYRGAFSLDPGSRGDETFDLTLYAGVRLWNEGEFYVNPELDQGFGLSTTVGVAGFTSGEAYKVGKTNPYVRFHRAFFRQTFDLGGDAETVEPDANQLGHTQTADKVVVTIGKITATDMFDTNTYAHDPRRDFSNWAIVDSGAYDYAADAWGYSYGAVGEWTQSWWTLRAGFFDLSTIPNTTTLDKNLGQFELVAEAEERHTWWAEAGKLKLLGYVNRGHMGSYDDAVALGIATHATPDSSLVRKYASRPGAAINFEQKIDDNLGLFARASINDGSKEAFEFTEINRSLAAGLSLEGTGWGRPNDTVGLAGVVDALSAPARRYFAAGGIGILIGDGQLPRYNTEDILETYYNAQLTPWLAASVDYQFIANPAYNSDRGPVSVFGARLHAQI